ncbi:uncharacterized protein LOC115620338 [Scaptodrosophila lebanonensis]|uniref:Uncharacterized protein LOC115620338 n=1 Tax=Drosophila lebanonensis TaxID=7225 RepID=A0A6J2SXU3_DROLE|nr:uncharacterized protein LOC115620338 [Scaptodrosophila lebanonensis]XP_030369396.1 uncharacterized protein LOC115620338 [Scaptodrosophila lebanonensis]
MIQEPTQVQKEDSDFPSYQYQMKSTWPILIHTQPYSKIILLKLPRSQTQSNRTEQSAPRTRFIRIPFLPGSVPATASVKQATPTASFSLASPITLAATTSRTAPTMTIFPEECSNSYSLTYQAANDQAVGPPSETSVQIGSLPMMAPTVEVSSPNPPQTLASMAGIQLTGSELLSQQDMSGAMPTATVEEINVPVFIDEYLQDIEAASSRNSNKSDNGNEICTETDICDFNMDLIAGGIMDDDQLLCSIQNKDDIFDNNLDFFMEDIERNGNLINISGNLHVTLDSCMKSSQNPMLGSFSQNSEILFNEEPMIPDNNSITENFTYCSQNSLGFGNLEHEEAKPIIKQEVSGIYTSYKINENICVGAKRTASTSGLDIFSTQPAKRSNLKLSLVSTPNPTSQILNTPQLVDSILDFEELKPKEEIHKDLLSTEENTVSTFNDFSAPNTPQSTYSAVSSSKLTNRTGGSEFITAPVSPASPASTISTSQFSIGSASGSVRRKRGRPAKEHSDGPDPELMSRLDDEERKAYTDRLKNNEASRQSRKKTKQREEEEIQEEKGLTTENDKLKIISERLQRQENRLKKAVENRFLQNSTYNKHGH